VATSGRALALTLAVLGLTVAGCTPERQHPTTAQTPTTIRPTSSTHASNAVTRNFDSKCRVATPAQWQRVKDAAALRLAEDETVHQPSTDGRVVLIQKRQAAHTVIQVMDLPSQHRSTIATLASGSQASGVVDDDWVVLWVMPKNFSIQLFDLYSYERSTGRLKKIGSSATDPQRGAAWGPLPSPQISAGYALWAQGTADRRSALHRYQLSTGTDAVLDTDINTGEAFSVTGRTVWYMKTDQPRSGAPTFTLRHKDIPTGKDLPVPAELRSASTGAGAVTANDRLVLWVSGDALTLSAWSKDDGVVVLHRAADGFYIDFPFLAGPFALWTGDKHEVALDLRSGSYTDITKTAYDLPGYALGSGGTSVTVTDARSGASKAKLGARHDAVIDVSQLDPLPTCKTGRGLRAAR